MAPICKLKKPGGMLMAVSFVGNQMQGSYQCLPHSHPEWEILFNLDGEGDLFIGDRHYKFTPGSVFLPAARRAAL